MTARREARHPVIPRSRQGVPTGTQRLTGIRMRMRGAGIIRLILTLPTSICRAGEQLMRRLLTGIIGMSPTWHTRLGMRWRMFAAFITRVAPRIVAI